MTTSKKQSSSSKSTPAAVAGNVSSNPTVQDPNLVACLTSITAASTARAAAPFGDAVLTAAERKGSLKLPPKGAKLVSGLAGLWGKYGAAFPTVDLSQMETQLSESQELRVVARAASGLARGLDDGALSAESAVWSTATQIYTLLQTIARKDKTLSVALEPYATYFQEPAKTAKANEKAKSKAKAEEAPVQAASSEETEAAPAAATSATAPAAVKAQTTP